MLDQYIKDLPEVFKSGCWTTYKEGRLLEWNGREATILCLQLSDAPHGAVIYAQSKGGRFFTVDYKLHQRSGGQVKEIDGASLVAHLSALGAAEALACIDLPRVQG